MNTIQLGACNVWYYISLPYQALSVSLFIKQTYQYCFSCAVTLGEALIPRPDLKPFSLHMVVVMRDVIFKRGKITAFHAFFNETPTVFCFQIWRPRADDTMLTMTLAGERCVNSSMSGNLTVSS